MSHTLTSHYSSTLRLGIPIAIGQLGIIIQGFADTMMVGQYATEALAASSFVNQLFNLVTFLLIGYSCGLTPLVSGAYGRGDHAEASKFFKNALGSNTLFWAVLAAIMGTLYFFLDHLGQDPTLLPLMRPYYLIIFSSVPFVMLFNVFRQFTDGTNDTAVAMWSLVASNALNILGNYLLIFGVAGFPELGLMGAGISTLFSRMFMVVMLGAFILFNRRYAIYREGFRKARLCWDEMKRVHRMSLPVAMQLGIETGCFTFSCIMAGWIGKVEMASFQVLMTIGSLGFLFYYSFGAGMSIRMGTFAGTKDWAQAHLAMKAGIHILLVLATLISIVFFWFREQLVSSFSSDPAVYAVSMSLIAPLIVYQFTDALQIGLANALRGVSQVVAMMRASIVSYLIIGLPVSYLLGFPLEWGVVGIFYAFSISLGTASAIYYVYYRRFMRPLLAE